jgi:hypothetical protein
MFVKKNKPIEIDKHEKRKRRHVSKCNSSARIDYHSFNKFTQDVLSLHTQTNTYLLQNAINPIVITELQHLWSFIG